MKFAPPRGMRDFYPEDFRPREALFDAWRESARLFGFEGIDAPVVETEELLTRKGGEEIIAQIYTFQDKSGRRLALRPEFTPSLARMIVARQGQLSFPLKWSCIVQCFRYERMSRGRKREHYQWNLDAIGEESIMAETEIVGAAVESFRRLGLTAAELQVRVGSRALLGELFAQSGIGPGHFMACCLALDKRGKITDDETKTLLEAEGLGPADIDRVFDLLAVRTLDQAAGRVAAGSPAIADLESFFTLAGQFGFRDYLAFDVSIVRGLGYYTGIVFEGFDTQGKFRAVFGGGRYDNLLEALGGKRCPCVGFGYGDVVIQELLADLGKLPGGRRAVDYAIGYMDETCRAPAVQAATRLRRAGRSTEIALSAEKPKKFFARADRIGARQAIIIGPEERDAGQLKIKDMQSGDQRTATLDEL